MKRRKGNLRNGFTFIEILLVIGIIGIFLLVSFPSIQNTMKTRQLENTARQVLTTLQSAKFQAIKQRLNYRVRFDDTKGRWEYFIEREIEFNNWQPIENAPNNTLPSDYVVTVNLPSQQVVYTPLGLVQNYDPNLHSISLQNPNLSTVSLTNVRIVNIFAGGSVQYVKPS